MTDLDSTQILNADESLVQNTSVVETEATLKILSGFEPKTFHIKQETIIGRAAPSDLVIAAPSLSKQHAKLTINNGQFFITDLGSSNKTFQNKVQLQSNVCYALHEGDEIKLGDILCSFHEQKSNNHHVDEIKTETITTSQTINDSYENSEPVQPVKIWNGNANNNNNNNNNNVHHTKESSTKSNGTTDVDEEAHLTITSTTLPESIPMKEEKTNTVTQMEETPVVPSINPIVEEPQMETSAPVDDVPTTTMETNAPAVCSEPPVTNSAEPMENSSPRPASEQLEIVPVSKLVEQLKDAETIADDSTPKEHIEVTINQDLVNEPITNDPMDTEETKSSENQMVIDEKPEEATEMIVNDEKTETKANIEEEKAAEMVVDQTEKSTAEEVQPTKMDEEPLTTAEPPKPVENETEEKMNDSADVAVAESTTKPVETDEPSMEEEEAEEEEDEGEGEGEESSSTGAARPKRGLPRKNARRARGRRAAATRARVISTKIRGTRRQAHPTTTNNEENDQTLEETIQTEPEESPEKSKPVTPATPEVKETRSKKTPVKEQKKEATPPSPPPAVEPTTTTSNSTVRTSARIKERASTGRNRQFPYTDDYVDLDDLEKQSKANNTKSSTTPNRKSTAKERPSKSPQKRVSLRQQPIESSKTPIKEDKVDVYDQIDAVPEITTSSNTRKRKSVTTPVTTAGANKRSRATTPQTAPPTNNRRKGTPTAVESSPTISKSTRRSAANSSSATTTTSAPPPPPPPPPPATTTTPKRASRKSTKATPTKEDSSSTATTTTPTAEDRPVRIALSSHLNFNASHLEILRGLGFEIMDESCQVDALVVDRIRRTKKFFMCLARGAHILSPSWIETMIKEKNYISYEKFYLEDTNAETRYGFQLRESVRLAKQRPIFANYKFFCTKETSPPYEDLKDIIEAAGGNLIDKINTNKPGKDLICIVGQNHKSEYEDLFRKGVPILSEEFVLSGISKQKLDFDSFSLFQNATTVKSAGK